MEELFERLLDSTKEWTELLNEGVKSQSDIIELERLKWKIMDNLNDYIDKRIELYNRK